jgi:hypothetical protein
MANNNLNGTENILVKVDENNLIFIDPNSVQNGLVVEQRNIQQENLVMYVNLEADLVPRSILTSDGNQSNTGQLVSIAKGTLNFLQNHDGKDYTTSWTETYTPNATDPFAQSSLKAINPNLTSQNSFDASGQSFGIESINIIVKGTNYIPTISINFTDVRGKTLFEGQQNSPYAAFFHLPWPIFYLTVKGYYGKAIRYRLHMTKFSSKYNESNGNFDITTAFVGSTYAYLNDIPLDGILNAPYMFYIESEANTSFNTSTGIYEKKISKSSKGYSVLKTIYDEYKAKGFIAKDFPVKTLREVIAIAKSLDKLLERKIFNEVVNFKVFNGIKEFEEKTIAFENAVTSWCTHYLSNEVVTINGVEYNYLSGQKKDSLDNIEGNKTTGNLEQIITEYPKQLRSLQLFTEEVIKGDRDVSFKKQTLNFVNSIKEIKKYYTTLGGNYVVSKKALLTDIYNIESSFAAERDKLEKVVEEKMNTIIKSDASTGGFGIGFEPTIKNIFAVVLANAETYVRLLKDVHKQAFDQGLIRKGLLQGFTDETPKNDAIYPWPQVLKLSGSDKKKIAAYPGDPDLQNKLNSNDKILWPEVDFVENYVGVSTKRIDTLAEKEGGVGNVSFIFGKDISENDIKPISNILNLSPTLPYVDKSISSIFYEIYERSVEVSLYDNLENSMKDLANFEFYNVLKSFEEDYDIFDLIKSISGTTKLVEYLSAFSPFEKYPYYNDKIPTTNYIKNVDEFPFDIIQYYGNSKKVDFTNQYLSITADLKNYTVENWRKNIYPFNSLTYLNYINETSFENSLTFLNTFQIDTTEGFIRTPNDIKGWVKSDYVSNMFSQNLQFGDSSVNILNTPFFHKQLFLDFNKEQISGKYVGSAYLLLNSLPFYDLQDNMTLNENSSLFVNPTTVRMSSLFREMSGSQYVPYHLILKWGSIYHRYKKYILEGVDILANVGGNSLGFIENGLGSVIDNHLFFNDNLTGSTYTGFTMGTNGVTVKYGETTPGSGGDVGIHPFYDAVFHQIINGYSHYDITGGTNSYKSQVDSGVINTRNRINGYDNNIYFTSFVDNSKMVAKDSYYTLLPCDGANFEDYLNITNRFENTQQSNYRVIWQNEVVKDTFTGYTFNTYKEYNRGLTNNITTLNDSGFKKVIDLIATFNPNILDKFESYFLDFATERVNVEFPYSSFPTYTDTNGTVHKVRYSNFQDLLKDIVTIDKTKVTSTEIKNIITDLKNLQSENLKTITSKLLSTDNVIKITLGNPKEINLNVWDGFAQINTTNNFRYDEFTSSNYLANKKYIELYIGEDIESLYQQFFESNNINVTEENVLNFRSLVYLFAGGLKDNKFTTKPAFQQYIYDNVLLPAQNRQSKFLNQLIFKINSSEFQPKGVSNDKVTPTSGYNDPLLKLETYSFFKSFNDKWTSGNSIGQRNLIEEFLFLDKANRDIGDKVFIDLKKLIQFEDPRNDKSNLYSAISMLIAGTNFDMRALPAYVNFYGTNFSGKSKVLPSREVAKSIFGTFLEVDYQDASPKIILQYLGPNSHHLEVSDISEKYKFKNDSGNLFNGQNSPLLVTIPDVFATGDLAKSNKVVSFEVSVGDQDQGIFKSVQLDQTSIRNTTESFSVYEGMGRSESGAGAMNVDIGLFDIYRQASYTCEVTMMGNVMIQPTMYFYLKNVPLFRGSYWITEVSHSIRENRITTSFKGSRIPYRALPDPKDSFFTSYRILFDSIMQSAQAKKKLGSEVTGNGKVITTDAGSVTVDMGPANKNIPNESITLKTGVDQFGIPYNGYNNEENIQLVNNGTWYRAIVAEMGGGTYKIEDSITMSLLNNVTVHNFNPSDTSGLNKLTVTPLPMTWGEISSNTDNYFYSTHFQLDVASANKIISAKTTFKNPLTNVMVDVEPFSESTMTKDNIKGPINYGPVIPGYGMGLSKALMLSLGLKDGDVVYFMLK